MKKLLMVLLLVVCTGCASTANLISTRSEMKNERIVKMIQVDNKGFVGAVDIGALDVIKKAFSEHPWRTSGALILDTLTGYAIYEGVRWADEQNEEKTTVVVEPVIDLPEPEPSQDIEINIDGSENINIEIGE